MTSILASPMSANATLLEQLISPSTPSAPFYLVPDRASLIPGLSDRYLSVGIPVVIYWLLGGLFFWLDKMEFPYFEARRIHESPEVERRNRVTMPQVRLFSPPPAPRARQEAPSVRSEAPSLAKELGGCLGNRILRSGRVVGRLRSASVTFAPRARADPRSLLCLAAPSGRLAAAHDADDPRPALARA